MVAERTSAAWTVVIIALLAALFVEWYVPILRSTQHIVGHIGVAHVLGSAPSFLHSFAFSLSLCAFARMRRQVVAGTVFVILCEIAAECVSMRVWPAGGSVIGSWEYWRATFDWNDIIAAVAGSICGSGLITLVEGKR